MILYLYSVTTNIPLYFSILLPLPYLNSHLIMEAIYTFWYLKHYRFLTLKVFCNMLLDLFPITFYIVPCLNFQLFSDLYFSLFHLLLCIVMSSIITIYHFNVYAIKQTIIQLFSSSYSADLK